MQTKALPKKDSINNIFFTEIVKILTTVDRYELKAKLQEFAKDAAAQADKIAQSTHLIPGIKDLEASRLVLYRVLIVLAQYRYLALSPKMFANKYDHEIFSNIRKITEATDEFLSSHVNTASANYLYYLYALRICQMIKILLTTSNLNNKFSMLFSLLEECHSSKLNKSTLLSHIGNNEKYLEALNGLDIVISEKEPLSIHENGIYLLTKLVIEDCLTLRMKLTDNQGNSDKLKKVVFLDSVLRHLNLHEYPSLRSAYDSDEALHPLNADQHKPYLFGWFRAIDSADTLKACVDVLVSKRNMLQLMRTFYLISQADGTGPDQVHNDYIAFYLALTRDIKFLSLLTQNLPKTDQAVARLNITSNLTTIVMNNDIKELAPDIANSMLSVPINEFSSPSFAFLFRIRQRILFSQTEDFQQRQSIFKAELDNIKQLLKANLTLPESERRKHARFIIDYYILCCRETRTEDEIVLVRELSDEVHALVQVDENRDMYIFILEYAEKKIHSTLDNAVNHFASIDAAILATKGKAISLNFENLIYCLAKARQIITELPNDFEYTGLTKQDYLGIIDGFCSRQRQVVEEMLANLADGPSVYSPTHLTVKEYGYEQAQPDAQALIANKAMYSPESVFKVLKELLLADNNAACAHVDKAYKALYYNPHLYLGNPIQPSINYTLSSQLHLLLALLDHAKMSQLDEYLDDQDNEEMRLEYQELMHELPRLMQESKMVDALFYAFFYLIAFSSVYEDNIEQHDYMYQVRLYFIEYMKVADIIRMKELDDTAQLPVCQAMRNALLSFLDKLDTPTVFDEVIDVLRAQLIRSINISLRLKILSADNPLVKHDLHQLARYAGLFPRDKQRERHAINIDSAFDSIQESASLVERALREEIFSSFDRTTHVKYLEIVEVRVQNLEFDIAELKHAIIKSSPNARVDMVDYLDVLSHAMSVVNSTLTSLLSDTTVESDIFSISRRSVLNKRAYLLTHITPSIYTNNLFCKSLVLVLQASMIHRINLVGEFEKLIAEMHAFIHTINHSDNEFKQPFSRMLTEYYIYFLCALSDPDEMTRLIETYNDIAQLDCGVHHRIIYDFHVELIKLKSQHQGNPVVMLQALKRAFGNLHALTKEHNISSFQALLAALDVNFTYYRLLVNTIHSVYNYLKSSGIVKNIKDIENVLNVLTSKAPDMAILNALTSGLNTNLTNAVAAKPVNEVKQKKAVKKGKHKNKANKKAAKLKSAKNNKKTVALKNLSDIASTELPEQALVDINDAPPESATVIEITPVVEADPFIQSDSSIKPVQITEPVQPTESLTTLEIISPSEFTSKSETMSMNDCDDIGEAIFTVESAEPTHTTQPPDKAIPVFIEQLSGFLTSSAPNKHKKHKENAKSKLKRNDKTSDLPHATNETIDQPDQDVESDIATQASTSQSTATVKQDPTSFLNRLYAVSTMKDPLFRFRVPAPLTSKFQSCVKWPTVVADILALLKSTWSDGTYVFGDAITSMIHHLTPSSYHIASFVTTKAMLTLLNDDVVKARHCIKQASVNKDGEVTIDFDTAALASLAELNSPNGRVKRSDLRIHIICCATNMKWRHFTNKEQALQNICRHFGLNTTLFYDVTNHCLLDIGNHLPTQLMINRGAGHLAIPSLDFTTLTQEPLRNTGEFILSVIATLARYDDYAMIINPRLDAYIMQKRSLCASVLTLEMFRHLFLSGIAIKVFELLKAYELLEVLFPMHEHPSLQDQLEFACHDIDTLYLHSNSFEYDNDNEYHERIATFLLNAFYNAFMSEKDIHAYYHDQDGELFRTHLYNFLTTLPWIISHEDNKNLFDAVFKLFWSKMRLDAELIQENQQRPALIR